MRLLHLLVLLLSAVGRGGRASRTCESEFGDLPSRTLQSSIVFQGRMLGRSTIIHGRYNATFSVISILKGSLPMKSTTEYMPVITGDFAELEDVDMCLPTARLGESYILFLKPQSQPRIPYYSLKGFPELPSRKTSRIITETILCEEKHRARTPSCCKSLL